MVFVYTHPNLCTCAHVREKMHNFWRLLLTFAQLLDFFRTTFEVFAHNYKQLLRTTNEGAYNHVTSLVARSGAESGSAFLA